MFNYTPNFSQYLMNADECYSSGSSFEETCHLLEFLSTYSEEEKKEPLSLTENILVIETKEGVFIRAQEREWCEMLTALTKLEKDNPLKVKIIPLSDWNNLTIKYSNPMRSQGNERLA